MAGLVRKFDGYVREATGETSRTSTLRVPGCGRLAWLSCRTGDPQDDLNRDVLISCPLAGRP